MFALNHVFSEKRKKTANDFLVRQSAFRHFVFVCHSFTSS